VGDTEWRECQLGDLLTLQRGFDLPYHARKPGRVPIVSSSGPSGFHSEAKCKAPGIVTGRYGTLGEVHFINEDYWPHNTALYVKDMKGNDPRFLYYLLGYTNLAHHNDKSGVPGVNRNDLHQIEVLRPPLPEQRSIARVLGGLDDKIELNRRMNRTLEDLARGVFRSWFVDFDPVLRRAGAAGTARGVTTHTPHTPPPLHWPARLVDPPAGTALGPIPEGWRVCSLREAFDINPMRRIPAGQPAPYLDMQNMPTASAVPDGWITRACGSGMKFQNGDTLMARITPCLENGKTAYVNFLDDGQVGWGSTEYIVLRSKPPLPPEYSYFLARDEDFRSFAIANMTGSSGRQRVPATAFDKYLVVVPDAKVAAAFGAFARDVLERVRMNSEESRKLAATRDALLPVLLSGEVRLRSSREEDRAVREAERAVGESLHATGTPRRGDGITLPRIGKAACTTKGRA
jgi:type I restriction enzyme S subunit